MIRAEVRTRCDGSKSDGSVESMGRIVGNSAPMLNAVGELNIVVKLMLSCACNS